jgi:hypothetical protein
MKPIAVSPALFAAADGARRARGGRVGPALACGVLMGVLTPAVWASPGGVALFWSTTGLANSSMQYSTALTNFLPIISATPVSELPAGTYDLYLWGRFIEGWLVEPYGRIWQLDPAFAGDASHAENVAYRQYKTGAGAYRRWDGTLGIPLDGLMGAVTARGIEFIIPPDTNNDLYFPASYEFLLGAARVTGAPGQVQIVDVTLIRFNPAGYDPLPENSPAVLTFTPEPAAGLLVVLGALLRRRPRRLDVGSAHPLGRRRGPARAGLRHSSRPALRWQAAIGR